MAGVVLLAVFLVLAVLGIPIAYAMGITTLVALVILEVSLATFFSQSIGGVDVFALLAVPFFIFVGELLTGGGMSRRLLKLASSLFGWVRGGQGMVNVGASVLFAGISGSAAADTAAIGSVMIPEMKKEGYRPAFAAAVTASSATIGALIPPSVVLIIYGGLTGLSIGGLFLAGVGPGLLVGAILLVFTWWGGRRQVTTTTPFTFRGLLVALRGALLAAGIPVLLVTGILTGFVTATEAGVLGVIYALIVGFVVYRELSWQVFVVAAVRTVELTAILLFLLAMAKSYAWVLTWLGTPRAVLEALTTLSVNPVVLIVLIVAFLLVLGMFVETIAAATISVPILLPVGAALGYEPLHFGIIIVFALLIGTITPPIGVLLFLAASIAATSIASAVRASLPFLIALLVCLAIIVGVPEITTWLPSIAR